MTSAEQKRGRLKSPDDVWEALADHLPAWLGNTLWNLSIIIRWLLLPAAFLSVVVDLKVVGAVGEWLIEHAGALGVLIGGIGTYLHLAAEAWRSLTAPLFSWIDAFLPFYLPRWLFDLTSAVLVAAPGSFQYMWTIVSHRSEGGRFVSVTQRDIDAAHQKTEARLAKLDEEMDDLDREQVNFDAQWQEINQLPEHLKPERLTQLKAKVLTAASKREELKQKIARERAALEQESSEMKRRLAAGWTMIERFKRQHKIARVLMVSAAAMSALAIALLVLDWLLF
jgi:hypothetical protein